MEAKATKHATGNMKLITLDLVTSTGTCVCTHLATAWKTTVDNLCTWSDRPALITAVKFVTELFWVKGNK